MRFYWFVQGLLWTLLLVCLINLTGCAAYTVATATSWGTTGKGMTDHGASLATGADCNASHIVMKNRDFYCEKPREPGTTYNRNAF
jgi:hypothetical protein